jgi:hypothetical protein
LRILQLVKRRLPLEKWLRANRKEQSMMYYAGFDTLAIREHNEGVLKEVSRLILEKRLRDNCQPRSGRPFAFTLRRILPVPR